MQRQSLRRFSSTTSSTSTADDFISSDHVKVVVRCRPLNDNNGEERIDHLQINPDKNNIEVQGVSATKTYRFSCVADENKSQKFMFDQVGRPIVDCALAGFNGTIITYGQTGSGKTYTMQGNTRNTLCAAPSPRATHKNIDGEEQKGIIQMVCESIFDRKTSENEKILIQASYLEMHNETLIDLLSAETNEALSQQEQLKLRKKQQSLGRNKSYSHNINNKLTIREDTAGSITVVGLNQFEVDSPERCYELLEIGARKRKVACTKMNLESSRSHAIFTINITKKNISSGTLRTSRLYLVDLAGSERQKLTGTSGVRLREAGGINKSLSALGNVINSICSGNNNQNNYNRTRVPSCRESKLTFLLKDALGGNSKLCVIATISPCLNSINETISTLEFAQRCTAIKNVAIVNETLSSDMKQLHNEITKLQVSLKTTNMNLSQSKNETVRLKNKIIDLSTLSTSAASIEKSRQTVKRIETGTQTEPGEVDDLILKIKDMIQVNEQLWNKVMEKEEMKLKNGVKPMTIPCPEETKSGEENFETLEEEKAEIEEIEGELLSETDLEIRLGDDDIDEKTRQSNDLTASPITDVDHSSPSFNYQSKEECEVLTSRTIFQKNIYNAEFAEELIFSPSELNAKGTTDEKENKLNDKLTDEDKEIKSTEEERSNCENEVRPRNNAEIENKVLKPGEKIHEEKIVKPSDEIIIDIEEKEVKIIEDEPKDTDYRAVKDKMKIDLDVYKIKPQNAIVWKGVSSQNIGTPTSIKKKQEQRESEKHSSSSTLRPPSPSAWHGNGTTATILRAVSPPTKYRNDREKQSVKTDDSWIQRRRNDMRKASKG